MEKEIVVENIIELMTGVICKERTQLNDNPQFRDWLNLKNAQVLIEKSNIPVEKLESTFNSLLGDINAAINKNLKILSKEI